MLDAVQKKYELLTPDEKSRNTNKEAELFISPANKNFLNFQKNYIKENENEVTFKYAKSGLSGKIFKLGTFNPEGVFNFP